jgi:hypothetical protein
MRTTATTNAQHHIHHGHNHRRLLLLPNWHCSVTAPAATAAVAWASLLDAAAVEDAVHMRPHYS